MQPACAASSPRRYRQDHPTPHGACRTTYQPTAYHNRRQACPALSSTSQTTSRVIATRWRHQRHPTTRHHWPRPTTRQACAFTYQPTRLPATPAAQHAARDQPSLATPEQHGRLPLSGQAFRLSSPGQDTSADYAELRNSRPADLPEPATTLRLVRPGHNRAQRTTSRYRSFAPLTT